MPSIESIRKFLNRVDGRVYESVWNDAESRPRTLVRLFLAIIPFMFVLLGSGIARVAVSSFLPLGGLGSGTIGRMVSVTGAQVYGSVALTAAIVITAWTVDRRRFPLPSYRVAKRWGSDLVFGLALGLTLQVGILFVGLATGSIEVTGVFTGRAGQTPLLWISSLVVFYLCIGLREEVLFRWYLMKNLAEGSTWFDGVDRRLAVWSGIAMSAVAFSLWHFGSSVQFLVFAGCFGVFFGLAYALTGSVALPIGVHAAWDLGQTGLFASQSLGTDTMVKTTAGNPVMILGGVSLMDVVPFFAVLLATIGVAGWARYREGDDVFHEEIAVPSLHSRLDYRPILKQIYGDRFEGSD